jgi:hypothetical protein
MTRKKKALQGAANARVALVRGVAQRGGECTRGVAQL